MANDVKFRRSAVPGKVPLVTDIDLGEIAINTYDGKLFAKKDNGTQSIFEISSPDIPFVVGTQPGTTASWTGVVPSVESLYNGLSIRYWLPQTSVQTNVTLNLTLKDGTSSGDIPVYYGGTTRLTTHYPAGSFVMLTYVENQLIGATSYTGWWAKANYVDGTESYTVRWNSTQQVGVEVTQYKICMAGLDGKLYPLSIGNTTANTKTPSTVQFLLNSRILIYQATATLAANGTGTSVWYEGIGTTVLNYTLNQSSGFVAYKPVFLKGTVNTNGTFVLDNTTLTSWFTQDLPTSEDGFVYILLVIMSDTTTGFRLPVSHPIYEYKGGSVVPYSGLTKTSLGLGDVDNTSDTAKPVSTAQQTALNLKANIASPVFTGNVTGLGVATGTSFNAITGLSSTTPLVAGTATAGTGTTTARNDHVHPAQTTITGNAASATTLSAGDDRTKLDGIAVGATANTGTVTSVAASAGTGISVTGSPISTSGTLAITNTAPNVTTNLTTTHNASTVAVNSSDGTNGTINAATTSLAGVLSSTDKTKLDSIATGAQVNVATDLSATAGTTAGPTINSSTGTNVVIPSASATNSGVVTTGDQTFAGTKTFGTVNATELNADNLYSLSDINKKTNINNIEDGLNIINKLQGVDFDWKSTGLKSSGVIAQELEKVLPHLVATNNGVKSVNYNGIIGYLIESIHEQQKQIDHLFTLNNSKGE